MSFVPSFTVNSLTDPTSFQINDTSTGSDTNIVGRRVYLVKSDGTYLIPVGNTTNYIDFPLTSGNTLTLTGILNVDYCLNIIFDWVGSGGTVLYETTGIYLFTANSELFYCSLGQKLVANPNLSRDTYWYGNRLQLRVEIDCAINAQKYSDQVSSQQALDRANYLIVNQSLFF
jgi:hypothetical protein